MNQEPKTERKAKKPSKKEATFKKAKSTMQDLPKSKKMIFDCVVHGRQRYASYRGALYCPICEQEKRENAMLSKSLCDDSKRAFENCVKSLGLNYSQSRVDPYTLKNFKAGTQEKEKAVYVASRFSDNFINRLITQHKEKMNKNPQWNAINSRGLIFAGTTGTGKTHLSKAILSRLKEFGVYGLYIRFNDLIEVCSARDGMLRRSLIRKLSVLVIDELGANYWGDRERELLSQIIDERTESGNPTIITHNLDKVELKNFAGERLLSRLSDTDKFYKVVCAWEDYRTSRKKKTIESMF